VACRSWTALWRAAPSRLGLRQALIERPAGAFEPRAGPVDQAFDILDLAGQRVELGLVLVEILPQPALLLLQRGGQLGRAGLHGLDRGRRPVGLGPQPLHAARHALDLVDELWQAFLQPGEALADLVETASERARPRL
jgi:hypothetical protein